MATDTICAVATPPGIGGLAVVRLSGPRTFPVLDRVVRGFRPSRQPDHSVRLGRVVVPGPGGVACELDEVVVAAFRAPRSYTGEDVAEVSCHGGDYIAGELVKLLYREGCRRAGPGEFSRRAVLNGRLSLSRAEAVVDLINARTPEAHSEALARYHGGLARRTQELQDELRECRARLEHHLGSDETGAAFPDGFAGRTRVLTERVGRLLAESARTRFAHEGARVVIVGRSNVGKSTLFNRLVGEERAVVAAVPGTTRDRVESTVAFGRVPVLLSDTAGMPARGRLPKRGNARSGIRSAAAGQTGQALAGADLIIAVFDGSQPPRPADRNLLSLPELAAGGARAVCVINKIDAGDRFGSSRLNGHPAVRVSALTGTGVERLRRLVQRRLVPPSRGRGSTRRGAAGTNSRHRTLLEECRAALVRSAESADAARALAELELADAALAGIDGPADRTDVLDRVFARFCVGK